MIVAPEPGKINALVLDQTKVWYDIQARLHFVGAMERTYVGNVIAFLLRDARRFHYVWWDQRRFKALGRTSVRAGNVDALPDFDPEAFDLAPNPVQTQDDNSVLWMLDRPLMHALLRQWVGDD